MTSPSPFRFFVALRLHAAYALVVLVCVAAVSLWTIVLSPSELDSGLGMLLFIQMFLASTGFVPAARRGYFDPLLVGGQRRTRVPIAHWIVSIGPGVAAWVVLALAAYALRSPTARSALAGRPVAALFIVSAMGWSAGFAFTRGAAGVAWIGALAALLVRHTVLMAGGPVSVLTMARDAATLVVCPFLLVGPGPSVPTEAVSIAVAISAGVLVIVWRWAGRIDVPLGGAM